MIKTTKIGNIELYNYNTKSRFQRFLDKHSITRRDLFLSFLGAFGLYMTVMFALIIS